LCGVSWGLVCVVLCLVGWLLPPLLGLNLPDPQFMQSFHGSSNNEGAQLTDNASCSIGYGKRDTLHIQTCLVSANHNRVIAVRQEGSLRGNACKNWQSV